MTDLTWLDATAQAELVRTGEVTPRELLDAAMTRIEAVDPQVNAVVATYYDEALAAATGDLPDGPFRGVPTLIKDLDATVAGWPHFEGTRFLRRLGYTPSADTTLVQRFRAAGFVLLGRTTTPEFGILPTTEAETYGATHNPWDLSRSAGGSSGGAAAAVAAGYVPVAHASDGAGSIRIPASVNGLVGLKPTRGRTPMGPGLGDVTAPLSIQLAEARSVRDVARLLDAVSGPAPGAAFAAPPPARPFAEELGAEPGRLRVGIMTQRPAGMGACDPECVAAVEATGRLLEQMGHAVEPAYPAVMDDAEGLPRFLGLWATGQAWRLDHWQRVTGATIDLDEIEPLTRALVEAGRLLTAVDYMAGSEWALQTAREVASWWAVDGFDLLVTPTVAELPIALGELAAPPDNPFAAMLRAAYYAPFCALFNLSGQPAISLPLHWSADGLPVGVQLGAAFGREDLLVRVAAQLEQALPWADRHPPLITA